MLTRSTVNHDEEHGVKFIVLDRGDYFVKDEKLYRKLDSSFARRVKKYRRSSFSSQAKVKPVDLKITAVPLDKDEFGERVR